MDSNTQNTWEKYPAALPKDTILAGKYIIKDVLGQGGFGITYLAEDYKTGAKAAVKEFFPETMAMRSAASLEVRTYTDERLDNFRFGMESFLEEAKVLAQFQGNPHIVGVQKYFEENGTAYFVMDYIEGIDFKTYIKQNGGKLPWEEVWKVMSPIMDALDAVHKKGLVHRDVTPDNIFISKDGTVKLLDFGAARYSLGDRSKSLDVVLKAGYAPKEQYTRRGKQGPFTDVYSTGACFYAALSGYLPPESLDRMEEDNLVPLSARGVKLPDNADEAVIKALEVRAEDRFQAMAEFKQAIIGEDQVPVQNAAENKTDEKMTPIQSPAENKADEKITQVSETAGGSGKQEEEKLFAGTDDMDSVQNAADGQNDRTAKKLFSNKKRIGIAAAVILISIGIGLYNNANRNGYHTRSYKDGSVYVGNFKAGERNGKGTYTYANGDKYEGQWSYDVKYGQGIYTYANGDMYDGEWRDDERNGQGKMIWTDGSVYEGEWENGSWNGQGTITYRQDNPLGRQSYEGGLKYNKLDGQGKMTYANGDVYEGEWKDGERNGQGKLIGKDGYVYEGEWENDVKNGQGKFTWTDGNMYEGEFKNDVRNGWGKMIYSSGDVYEGEWKDDERSGQGKLTWTTGTIYEGGWKDDKLNGQGKAVFSDGSMYEGGYKDNQWDGYGVYIHADGSKEEGNWKAGKKAD